MPFSKGRSAPQNAFLETLAQKFKGNVSNFILGNAQADRNYQIVYCSDGFCQLTGFSRTELMQQSCSCGFLAGMSTGAESCLRISNALSTKAELTCEIQFYKKSGAPFWCLLDILPIKNETGAVVLFLVSHKDITHEKVSGLETEIITGRESTTSSNTSTHTPKLRKFSRDVLFHIQRQYQSKNSRVNEGQCQQQMPNGTSTKLGGSLPSYPTQYANNTTKATSRYVIMHFGRVRFVWDWLVLLLVLYVAIVTPFHAAFDSGTPSTMIYFRVFDLTVELIFMADIGLNFRTTYIDKDSGQLVTELGLIAKYYVTHWFAIDFLAAIPYEFLLLINSSWGQTVNVLKVSRLLRITRAARRFGRYTENTVILLLLLMLSFALLGHWLSCIWYVIGCRGLRVNDVDGWLQTLGEQINKPYINHSLSTGPSQRETYVSSLYFVLTSLTTVGFGNIAPNTLEEKLFSIVVLLIGALVQSAIFGNMTAVIHKLYAERAKFQSKSAEIKQFVHINRIEGDLRKRIEDYFLTSWSVSKGVDREEIMASFPIELRADISMQLYNNFLNLPMFRVMNLGLLRSLSLKIKHAQFTPGETILKEKDAVVSFYFVQEGTIEVVQKESIVAILGSGDTFGEEIFRRQNQIGRSNGDVKALTYCSLLYLTKDRVISILSAYPEIMESTSFKHDMVFNLTKETSCRSNRLDSIDECEEDEKPWDQALNGKDDLISVPRTPRSTRSSVTSNSSAASLSEMPLWQRQLRQTDSRDLTGYRIESLDNRLRQIEDDSGSEDNRSVDDRINSAYASPNICNSREVNERLIISNDEFYIDTLSIGHGQLRSDNQLSDGEDDSYGEAECINSKENLLAECMDAQHKTQGDSVLALSRQELDWDPSLCQSNLNAVDAMYGCFSLPDLPSIPPIFSTDFDKLSLSRTVSNALGDRPNEDTIASLRGNRQCHIEEEIVNGETTPNTDSLIYTNRDVGILRSPSFNTGYHSLPGRRRQISPTTYSSRNYHSNSLPDTVIMSEYNNGSNISISTSLSSGCDCEQVIIRPSTDSLTKCQQDAKDMIESSMGSIMHEISSLKRDINELKSAIMISLPNK